MGETIGVLIADDNVAFANLLSDYMSKFEDIRVLGVARDGLQALEMIKELSPDMVLLDIIMPNLDGIGVLERISSMQLRKKPLFIALSALGQDIMVQKVILLGAEYYIVKPFDIDMLVSRIRQIYREKFVPPIIFSNRATAIHRRENSEFEEPPRSLETEVTYLMLDEGIPPHLPGYRYLREAIIQTVLNDSKAPVSVTKVIYPQVAEKFGTTPSKVERAIRSAIESAWAKKGKEVQGGGQADGIIKSKFKPTNSEFIAIMAEKAKIAMQVR